MRWIRSPAPASWPAAIASRMPRVFGPAPMKLRSARWSPTPGVSRLRVEALGRSQPEAGAQIRLGGGQLRRGLAQPRRLQGRKDLGDQADADLELLVGRHAQEDPGGAATGEDPHGADELG